VGHRQQRQATAVRVRFDRAELVIDARCQMTAHSIVVLAGDGMIGSTPRTGMETCALLLRVVKVSRQW